MDFGFTSFVRGVKGIGLRGRRVLGRAKLVFDFQTAEMELRKLKRIETDGPPKLNENVWVDCGDFLCLGRLDTNGKWIDAFKGQELKGVLGYYPLN